MYSVDASSAQILIGYTDVFSDTIPDLKTEIEKLNMHKAISIICELIRIRDAETDPIRILGGEFRIPFEMVLKKQMCGIDPKSSEEMFSNPLLKKNIHIISVQMLLILLKKIIQYGNYKTMEETIYEVSNEDYKRIIRLQLVVAEEINRIHSEKLDIDHFLYSTYHLNYQRNVAHEFLRMYYMLEILNRDKNNFDKDVQREYRDYYTSFTEKYKFTPTQYSALLFWELGTYYTDINGLIYDTMWKSTESVYGKIDLNGLPSKVISTLSQKIEIFTVWAEESENQEWDFSKFLEFPFITDSKGNYISISDITLRNAFFEEIFWLIRNCYPEEDSRAMSFFGRLFEKYIRDITLDAIKEDYVYIEEFTYRIRKEDKKSSDAYIRKGTNLLAVEAKGFSVLLDCMTKNEKIEMNNDKLFVCPILQADKCLDAIIEERPEFTGVENVYIISVSMDNINAVPNYYNEIHAKIQEKKQSKKAKCFFNFNIEEYEMLMFLVEQSHDIFSLLEDYYDNTRLKPFGVYLLEKYPQIGMTSFMEKHYIAASENMKEMYFIE